MASKTAQDQTRAGKDFERLNNDLNPIWPSAEDGVPSLIPSKYDDDSSDDDSVDSYNTPHAPEGGDLSPPCDAPAPPRRSRRLRGERSGPEMINLASHPEYGRCNTSMVTDRMRDKGFIQANKAQLAAPLEQSNLS